MVNGNENNERNYRGKSQWELKNLLEMRCSKGNSIDIQDLINRAVDRSKVEEMMIENAEAISEGIRLYHEQVGEYDEEKRNIRFDENRLNALQEGIWWTLKILHELHVAKFKIQILLGIVALLERKKLHLHIELDVANNSPTFKAMLKVFPDIQHQQFAQLFSYKIPFERKGDGRIREADGFAPKCARVFIGLIVYYLFSLIASPRFKGVDPLDLRQIEEMFDMNHSFIKCIYALWVLDHGVTFEESSNAVETLSKMPTSLWHGFKASNQAPPCVDSFHVLELLRDSSSLTNLYLSTSAEKFQPCTTKQLEILIRSHLCVFVDISQAKNRWQAQLSKLLSLTRQLRRDLLKFPIDSMSEHDVCEMVIDLLFYNLCGGSSSTSFKMKKACIVEICVHTPLDNLESEIVEEKINSLLESDSDGFWRDLLVSICLLKHRAVEANFVHTESRNQSISPKTRETIVQAQQKLMPPGLSIDTPFARVIGNFLLTLPVVSRNTSASDPVERATIDRMHSILAKPKLNTASFFENYSTEDMDVSENNHVSSNPPSVIEIHKTKISKTEAFPRRKRTAMPMPQYAPPTVKREASPSPERSAIVTDEPDEEIPCANSELLSPHGPSGEMLSETPVRTRRRETSPPPVAPEFETPGPSLKAAKNTPWSRMKSLTIKKTTTGLGTASKNGDTCVEDEIVGIPTPSARRYFRDTQPETYTRVRKQY